MTLTFRYKEIRRPDGTAVRCPMVPITIRGAEAIATAALLDSGADVSAVPRVIAEAIGLDLTKPKTTAFGIGGDVKSLQTEMSVTIQKGHERYTFRVPVMVILDEYQFPVLLGRKGFFSQFRISFDEQNERVSLRKV